MPAYAESRLRLMLRAPRSAGDLTRGAAGGLCNLTLLGERRRTAKEEEHRRKSGEQSCFHNLSPRAGGQFDAGNTNVIITFKTTFVKSSLGRLGYEQSVYRSRYTGEYLTL